MVHRPIDEHVAIAWPAGKDLRDRDFRPGRALRSGHDAAMARDLGLGLDGTVDTNVAGDSVRSLIRTPGLRSEPKDAPLLAVEATGLLDTPVEERFDRFTALARSIWGAPMSTITLFDDERAFFKSRAGLEDLVEMPASQSFCGTVRDRDAPLVVTDATADADFSCLPGVTGDLGIRFYAGYPVRDVYGTTIGTMCLYDTEPREFGAHDLAVLAQLAGCVEEEVRATSDRDLATSVQQALLPHHVTPVAGYTFAGTCVPTGLVAGDAFDHRELEGGHYVLVADVMGKGTAAAILMSAVRAAIRSEMREFAELGPDAYGGLGRVLARARDVVQEDLDAAHAFVTAFVGWADPATGSLQYVDAGHGLSVVVHEDGRVTELGSTDLPVGIDRSSSWEEHRVALQPGDTFVCFSDGLLDVMPEADVPSVAVARLLEVADGPQAFVREVERLARSIPVRDDVTVLVVRRDLGS